MLLSDNITDRVVYLIHVMLNYRNDCNSFLSKTLTSNYSEYLYLKRFKCCPFVCLCVRLSVCKEFLRKQYAILYDMCIVNNILNANNTNNGLLRKVGPLVRVGDA